MSKDAISVIEAMKPYKGAENSLWRLHELNNINKHRYLPAITASIRGASAWGDLLKHAQLYYGGLAVGCEVARWPMSAGGSSNQPLLFFDVALNEPGAECCNLRLTEALWLCIIATKRTVTALEEFL